MSCSGIHDYCLAVTTVRVVLTCSGVEGMYSVTPEAVAYHIALRCAGGVVVDGFCGLGGNTIQLAMKCDRVIGAHSSRTRGWSSTANGLKAIDIDERRLAYCRRNAAIYHVEHKIEVRRGCKCEVVLGRQVNEVIEGLCKHENGHYCELMQSQSFPDDF